LQQYKIILTNFQRRRYMVWGDLVYRG